MSSQKTNREWIRLRQAYGATGREWARISNEDSPTADERRLTQIAA